MPSPRRVAFAALLLLLGGLSAAVPAAAPRLGPLTSEPVTLPPFADLAKGSRPGSEADYERARSDARFRMLRITYPSGDLTVVAFAYVPSDARERQPVVIYNRGGYIRQNTAPELLPTFHRLAEAGFTVVAPMYRGSEGAPGRDEMGGADLDDLMNVPPVAAALPAADASRLFLYGESRGGMMTLQALRDGFPARAAAVFGVFTDLERYLAEDSRAAAAAGQIWPDWPARRDAIAERRSAVRWAARITTPLLVMHGGDDTTVSPAHALRLAEALLAAGRPFELTIAAGARHVLQPFEAERDRRAIEWFRRHLAGEGAAAARPDSSVPSRRQISQSPSMAAPSER